MTDEQRDCRRVQRQLLARALADPPPAAGGPDPQLRTAADAHLARCPACRRYAAGLATAPEVFPPRRLYGPDLRRRTLTATADVRPSPRWTLALPLALAAILAPLMAFAAPTWLVALLVSYLVDTASLALLLSFVLVHASGAVVVTFCAATLLRRHQPNLTPQEVAYG